MVAGSNPAPATIRTTTTTTTMPATYEFTDQADEYIDRLIENDPDHEHLRLCGATIGVLFYHNDGQPMTHGGRTVAAYVKKTSLRDRVQGVRDAVITIDAAWWEDADDDNRTALIDHELYHLIPVVESYRPPKTEDPAEKLEPIFEFDAHHRPKFTMRKHDVEFGWFLRMCQKHGPKALEAQQARSIVEKHGQLLFGFTEEADELREPGAQAASRFVNAIRKMAKGSSVTVSSGGQSVTIEGEGK